MNKVDRIRRRLFAVEVLRILKRGHSYKELSKITGLAVPVLSRYINGHVLPGLDRSREIVDLFRERFLMDEIKSMITFEEGTDIFDHSRLLSNTDLLKRIAGVISQEFASVEVDKIMTKETDGVPIGVHLGSALGVDVVVARREKSMAIRDFVEVRRTYETGTYTYLYLPENLLAPGDRVLIVDDSMRTGSAMRALVRMCSKTKTDVAGIFVLIAVKESFRKLGDWVECPVRSLIPI